MYRRLFRISFPFIRRNPNLINERSAAGMEARFASSEKERQTEFELSLYDQHKSFLDEEKAHFVGEGERQERYEQMVARFGRVFAENERRHETQFLEADSRHEQTFETEENARDEIFAQGQRDRGLSFQNEQEARVELAKWQIGIQEVYFRDGQAARKITCAELEEAMEEQFEQLLRSQEMSFLSEEERRDGVVRSMVSIPI